MVRIRVELWLRLTFHVIPGRCLTASFWAHVNYLLTYLLTYLRWGPSYTPQQCKVCFTRPLFYSNYSGLLGHMAEVYALLSALHVLCVCFDWFRHTSYRSVISTRQKYCFKIVFFSVQNCQFNPTFRPRFNFGPNFDSCSERRARSVCGVYCSRWRSCRNVGTRSRNLSVAISFSRWRSPVPTCTALRSYTEISSSEISSSTTPWRSRSATSAWPRGLTTTANANCTLASLIN